MLWALVLRSFCEVVIAGEVDRRQVNLAETGLARDVTYALFSILPAVLASKVIAQKSPDILRNMLPEVEKETRAWLRLELDAITVRRSKTAPRISDVLERLKAENLSKNPAELGAEEKARRLLKDHYIRTLISRYGDWEPIRRWEGAEPASMPMSSPYPRGKGMSVMEPFQIEEAGSGIST
jgi:hypothetical protein